MLGKITTNGTSKCINIKKPFNHCSASLSLSFLQPSCQIPFHVSGEQETFNKTSLIEFAGRALCGLARAVAAVCLSSEKLSDIQFLRGFYSLRPNWCFEDFYASRPDKNRPYCASNALASGPEVAKKNEVSRTARGSTESWIVKFDWNCIRWKLTNVEFKQEFTDTRLKYIPHELVQTGAWGVCVLAILKYQDISNFGWTKSTLEEENKSAWASLWITFSTIYWSCLPWRQTEQNYLFSNLMRCTDAVLFV